MLMVVLWPATFFNDEFRMVEHSLIYYDAFRMVEHREDGVREDHQPHAGRRDPPRPAKTLLSSLVLQNASNNSDIRAEQSQCR